MAVTLPDGLCVENWTTHDVMLVDGVTGETWRIANEPRAPLRLNTRREGVSRFLQRVVFEEPTYEPPERDGVLLIVSSPVKLALGSRRQDLVTPNELVRNAAGGVTACRSFAL